MSIGKDRGADTNVSRPNEIESVEQELENILGGKEVEAKVLERLKTSNQGQISLVLRQLRSQAGEEALRKIVGLYTEFEYLKAREDMMRNDIRSVKEDLISIKLVLQVYNMKFAEHKLNPGFMQEVNRKLEQLK